MRAWLAVLGFALLGCRLPSLGKPEAVALPPRSDEISGAPSAWPEISFRAQSSRIPVLMYHDFVYRRGEGDVWYDASAEEFEAQMQRLKDDGFVPISLAQLFDHLTNNAPVPAKAIVITVDDNYQGFYDVAWPILRRFEFPVAMFVHTAYVGDTTKGRPKMTYDTLRELVKDPLFTVGAHTVTHPADMTILTPEQQLAEILDSKETLERELDVRVPWLAYPDGSNDSTTQAMARDAGIKMAFSVDNGAAEESPNILCVNRYVHTRLDKALEDREKSLTGAPAAVFTMPWKPSPVEKIRGAHERIDFAMVIGGKPVSKLAETRKTVGEFVTESGAAAGINGGFFNMAAIRGTDNKMVGPVKTPAQPDAIADEMEFRMPKLRNRPLVMWGPSGLAILPFQPGQMNSDYALRAFMRDMSDCFLAGVWLVHQGMPQTEDAMNAFGSKDIQDARRRAFFGVLRDGRIAVGASLESCSSAKLARVIAGAGVMEAVLLDSGFSTSLLFGDEILASGHSTSATPSRPVPHAIVLMGDRKPESQLQSR